MNVTKSLAALALGVVAVAGCSSSKGAASSGTTTTVTLPVHATTPTTTRRRGSVTTTTLTTSSTAPPTRSSIAATSASFVSPDDGFVLGAHGEVDATTDGGRTWHRVGSLPVHGTAPTIRYIDAADGFAFGPDAGTPQFLITHDGGATWSAVPNAPFTYIGDLAIARGMIYAIGMPPHGGDFHIWETPIEHLVWKQVPPTQQIGAGPVPIEQIVLNRGEGWLLNQDRGVISGARLTSSTTWTSWTPPCLKPNGPAWLSASTSTDLVATCDEGEYSERATPSAWFSHDGGRSFTRANAPLFGPVLSPNPQTAVIVGNATVQRTTNGGASWSVVARTPTGATRDYGFTTSTQGFEITGGQMLMTYDAGASWQPVTLP